ncbi:fungal-specific transcription factor domain-containing protein [Exophiala viscosa]|uniref:fungal-specific transcription factor domain-containing protein n=1 Tax=Exophiala viscosa TaxID=2486360 RepID=UPI002199164E|nr:fungal-specific transcription factor domain-containing protein [Exophiala viscosa]
MATSRDKEKKAASAAIKDSPSSKSSKMHRRSRSGCFTCRLRRKKCDEGKSKCRACRHLGLDCEYKRPQWWSNNETRRKQKEFIKTVIKRTKTTEKTVAAQSTYGTRESSSSGSQDDYDINFDPAFVTTPGLYDAYGTSAFLPHGDPYGPGYPWEVDVKTECQTFVNDELTRRDSSISTFSTFMPPPPPHTMLPSYTGDDWVQQDFYEHRQDSWATEDGIDFDFFEFPHLARHPEPQFATMIQLEDCDRPLFDHLLDSVLPLLFPVLEANQVGTVRQDVVLPALENNKAYLHSCLLAAATHLKDTRTAFGMTVEDDTMRHKLAFVSIVVEALNGDTHHSEMLDALLGMISLQGCVGSASDLEKELIPWHQHFQTAADIVQKLNLPAVLEELPLTGGHPPFNMTLTAWIDILGSTMQGKAPRFSNTYRNMFFANATTGLEKLMGCNDLVMYLLSEVACLDSLKVEGRLDDIGISSHIISLAKTLDQIEPTEPPQIPFSKQGKLRPQQLTKNITAVFRKATRVYLCSLVPEYDRHQPATVNLISQMADLLQYIPSGPNGFDRCLVWPMLICGVNSIPASPFRRMLSERCDMLGEAADHGSFGRMVRLLHEVWRRNDDMVISAGVCEATPVTARSPGESVSTPTGPVVNAVIATAAAANPNSSTTLPRSQNVHWRDVMQQNGWDFLLI